MASTTVTASASVSTPTPDPTLVLFARGVIARLELWPALRVAVEQGWGGPESRQKRRWLASVIVDAFEQHHRPVPARPPSPSPPRSCSSSNSPSSSPCMMMMTTITSGMNTGIEVGPAPLDAEYIAVILAQVVEDEFDALFEDGSIEAVAADIVGLWGASEEVVREWERRAEGARGKSVNLQEVVDEDEWEDEESEGSGDDGDDGEEVPQLMSPVVSTRRSAKPEPVVDEDGFTLVPKRR